MVRDGGDGVVHATRNRAWTLLPHRRRGKQTALLLVMSLACFAAFFALVASGQRGGDTFFSNWWLAGTMLPAAALAIAAGVTGVTAMIRERDRSLSTLVATALGLLVVVFVIGEIAFPH